MDKHKIAIFTNFTEKSHETQLTLMKKLQEKGYYITSEYSEDTALIVCIGGDGALLRTVHSCDFPQCPIVGVNTGHLGFFQEILPDDLDAFIANYESGNYTIQKLNLVKAIVTTSDGMQKTHMGLNEIVIRGRHSYSVHLNISIGDTPIERFSGDGILVATSSGSTAYNYSLGGSIVDPRLNLLQVTPIAPMNTTAYRSFTSSILLPSDLSLQVVPEHRKNKMIFVVNDGIETGYSDITKVDVKVSDTPLMLMRFKNYDFWNKVKTKFL